MGVSGEAVMAVEWTLFAFAYTLVALRIGLRLARKQQKHALISDIFLIISALVCLGLIVCDTLSYTLGALRPDIADADTITADDLAKQVALDKISFASNYFYDTGMYFPKATILSLYFELFPSSMPNLRKSLYAVTAFTATCGLTTCGLDTLFCAPKFSDNWSLEEGACSSFNSLLVLQIDWAMNIASDVLIFVLPLPILRILQLRRRQVYGLAVTFGLGLVTMATSIARFTTIQLGTDWNGVYVWSMAEMSVAIMVVSMPALKTLLTHWSKSSKSRSGSQSASRFTSNYSGQNASRRQARIGCTLIEETGSEVELNRVLRENVIVKTAEVHVDSRPVGSDRYSFAMQAWGKDTRHSDNESGSDR